MLTFFLAILIEITRTNRHDNTWMAIVTDLNRTNADRRANVINLRRRSPQIHIFPASWGASDECKAFLYDNQIRVNLSYSHGSGKIEEGKVGHWCSFLRFITECELSLYKRCMFIEDDVVLSPSEISQIVRHLQIVTFQKPILSIGPGGCDRINVFDRKQIPQIWDYLGNDGITNPTDRQLEPLYQSTGRRFGYLLDPNNQRSSSVIRNSRMLDIQTLNQEIDDVPHCKKLVSVHADTQKDDINRGRESKMEKSHVMVPPGPPHKRKVQREFSVVGVSTCFRAVVLVGAVVFFLCWWFFLSNMERTSDLFDST